MPEPSTSDKVINMHEAKSRLSQLGELAWRGERVVISKAGKPYLELVPYRKREVRKPGRFNGKIQIADDFDQTGEGIIQLFEGNEQAPRVVRQAISRFMFAISM
ncbi:type II toxin-antitoxin system Phd/YefM family antitoxin [Endozoicomonas euniceicola]|uniref:Type II toxin-antitoxin system prevent-host-death family antitoxin n=1 Tax=Endozoicomonas euniceicola TaxID=1234143 RepID=A0ABY6H0A9_9GAMM|nr:type II toxin-antitoxin system prevent-host-death family antitoxin [Endozoicomonas euniceicola]UYM18488.1 type II toxin-antitoxin system prevent-host-death family antitoxin [Endozoicomonas euniceicola]